MTKINESIKYFQQIVSADNGYNATFISNLSHLIEAAQERDEYKRQYDLLLEQQDKEKEVVPFLKNQKSVAKKSYYFVTYEYTDSSLKNHIRNAYIDVHPIDWEQEKKMFKKYDMFYKVLFFAEISHEHYLKNYQ